MKPRPPHPPFDREPNNHRASKAALPLRGRTPGRCEAAEAIARAPRRAERAEDGGERGLCTRFRRVERGGGLGSEIWGRSNKVLVIDSWTPPV